MNTIYSAPCYHNPGNFPTTSDCGACVPGFPAWLVVQQDPERCKNSTPALAWQQGGGRGRVPASIEARRFKAPPSPARAHAPPPPPPGPGRIRLRKMRGQQATGKDSRPRLAMPGACGVEKGSLGPGTNFTNQQTPKPKLRMWGWAPGRCVPRRSQVTPQLIKMTGARGSAGWRTPQPQHFG